MSENSRPPALDEWPKNEDAERQGRDFRRKTLSFGGEVDRSALGQPGR